MERGTRAYFDRIIKNGNAILFLGAGFSRGATNTQGNPMPLGGDLAEGLWDLALPGVPFEKGTPLGEVYEAATQASQRQVGEYLAKALSVDPDAVPKYYDSFLRAPWYRIYTLNLDDLLNVVARRLGITLKTSSALSSGHLLPPAQELEVVHLNGRLSDFPNVTFSPPQYGERTARSDTAYLTLVRELSAHPVVFVGTQLDEPTLWHHIALRGSRPGGRELRPRSFLVTRSLSAPRKAMLGKYHVEHVSMTAKEFEEQHLASFATSEPAMRPQLARVKPSWLNAAEELRDDRRDDLAEYLLGRQPTWADLVDGYAIKRAFDDRLGDLIASGSEITLITGTGGSGKSTAILRLAAASAADGRKTLWLNRDTSQDLSSIIRDAGRDEPDLCLIDDAERFGESLADFLARLSALDSKPQVVAATSSTKHEALMLDSLGDALTIVGVPHLHDDDISGLLDALERAHRLGRLAGLTRGEQVRTFRKKAGRQLLVALIEATSGRRFEDKIKDECQELAPELVLPYAVIALATTLRYRIRQDDVLATMGAQEPLIALQELQRLVRTGLVSQTQDRSLSARHPMIAEHVVAFYHTSDQLADPLTSLAFLLSTRVYVGMKRTPERRTLNTLINHDYLIRRLSDRSHIRGLYQTLEGTLGDDSHYWLQRGTYELEKGDIGQADIFLAQARGLAGGDYMVETEYAYLLLRKATAEPGGSQSSQWASEAIETLQDIVHAKGTLTPNTYAVLASQGSAWLDVAPMSETERKLQMQSIRGMVADGRRLHPTNEGLSAAAAELERRYLMLATRTNGREQ